MQFMPFAIESHSNALQNSRVCPWIAECTWRWIAQVLHYTSMTWSTMRGKLVQLVLWDNDWFFSESSSPSSSMGAKALHLNQRLMKTSKGCNQQRDIWNFHLWFVLFLSLSLATEGSCPFDMKWNKMPVFMMSYWAFETRKAEESVSYFKSLFYPL